MSKGIRAFTNEYELYLQDESRKKGFADNISFPASTQEVADIVMQCAERGIPITVRGGGTGVGAGAVPFGGAVISLERIKMLRMSPQADSVIVGAGNSLLEMNEFIKRQSKDKLFFPPDPTEATASAGGMVSCNSSGARTYRYGAVRNYVKRLKIVTAQGEILDIKRNSLFARGRELVLNDAFKNTSLKNIGRLPEYIMPEVKNASGYYVKEDMDIIDIFIGAEGTLGIITEVEFSLIKKPKYIWGIISFFKREGMGIDFSQLIKSKKSSVENVISVEFFDSGSLALLREKKKASPSELYSPMIPEEFEEAVFTELIAEDMPEMLNAIGFIEKAIISVGANPDDAWVAGSTASFETFKQLRHATPEAVNSRIAQIKKQYPSITKLGSDMAVPDKYFKDIVDMYKKTLTEADLKYVMFGHIGNSHLHVNIISRNEEEYFKGKKIFSDWAEKIGQIKGSISAEHGVGKLKRDFLIKMYGEKAVDEMRTLKKSLDSQGIIGRDNIFLWNK